MHSENMSLDIKIVCCLSLCHWATLELGEFSFIKNFSKYFYEESFRSRKSQFFSIPIICAKSPLEKFLEKSEKKKKAAKSIDKQMGKKKQLMILRTVQDLVSSCRAIIFKVIFKFFWCFSVLHMKVPMVFVSTLTFKISLEQILVL